MRDKLGDVPAPHDAAEGWQLHTYWRLVWSAQAVHHTHRAVVTLMVAALYGVGLRPGDRYFCPSSPAWGHGLAHGTISPLALGIHTASYSGKFDAARMFEALQELAVTNVAAAPTVFRMLRNSGSRDRYRIDLQKLSYTGEPMDGATMAWTQEAFGVVPCSMYGTTEVGVLIVNYPGLDGYRVKPGSLGKPVPGLHVGVVDNSGRELPPMQTGEIAVRRKSGWFHVKDRGTATRTATSTSKGGRTTSSSPRAGR